MKILYMRGSTVLSESEMDSFKGYRFEDAASFARLASGLKSAVIAGKYPAIEAALKDAEIDFEVVELSADVERAEAAVKAAKAAEEKAAQEIDAGDPEALKLISDRADAMEVERDSALRELEAANAVIAQLERELKAAYESGDDETSLDDIVDVFKVVDGVQSANASWHNITRAAAIENTAKNPDIEYNIVLDQG